MKEIYNITTSAFKKAIINETEWEFCEKHYYTQIHHNCDLPRNMQILKLVNANKSLASVGRKFNITSATVAYIVYRG